MMLSAFNLYAHDLPEPGEVLVHNTFSGAYLVLDNDVFAALEKRDRGEALDECECALVDDPDFSASDIGIVVADRDDEARAFEAWFDARRQQAEMRAIVAINRACNFDCPYCCQAESMDGAVMTPETVEKTATWLAQRARAVGTPSLQVTFVGGEPLLHPERIRQLMTSLQRQLASTDIALSMGVITNGYFLTEDMIASLQPLGLCIAQVTIDGDEHTHSRSRVSKQGEDTFARIFQNVLDASRHIQVVVNGNYQEDTISGFAPLIRKLHEAGFPTTHRISFSPALDILDAPAGSGSGSCTWSQASHHHQVALHDQLVRHGYPTSPLHSVGPCAFNSHHMYVVDVDGSLLKCPGFLGHPEWNIGDVERGLGERYQALLRLDRSATCGGCAHRPNCAGGCIANALIRSGEPDTGYDSSMIDDHCEIEYLHNVTRDALVRAYLLATSPDTAAALADFPAAAELPAAALTDSRKRGVRPASLNVLR